MEEMEKMNQENASQETISPESPAKEPPAGSGKKPRKFNVGENLKKLGLMILGVFKDYPVTMIAIVLA
ncbi:MAG: hypothetical protein J6X14_03310, partial [Lachnospiraceae bacterium]|nr:hypothetical protein [Lachnospiraceae bacterium]